MDTGGDLHYDATGLGRIHKVGFPTEIGLSSSIVAHPYYKVTTDFSPRCVVIGPGWEDGTGNKYWLSDFSNGIKKVEIKNVYEDVKKVSFEVVYFIEGGISISENHKIDATGVEIECRISNSVKKFLIQVPLLHTDGMSFSKVEKKTKGFVVNYLNCIYKVENVENEKVCSYFENFLAPNKNGIYKVGCFEIKGNYGKCKISFYKNGE